MKLTKFLLIALIGLAAPASAGAPEVKLRLTVQVSTASPLGANVVDYKNALAAASNGAIAIDVFDKAQLYVDFKVPGAVGSGEIEMGVAQIGLYAKDVPAVEIFQQPFIFDSDELTRAAASPESDIRRLIDEGILAKTGARVLWWQPYGANLIMSKGGALLNPLAMTGRSVRALDPVAAEFVTLCGGKPQVISGSKMLEALSAGKVDSVMTGVLGIPERELWRETQYVNRIRHSAILFLVIINEKVWQGLSKAQQALMQAEARKVEDKYWTDFARLEQDAYRFAVEKGMTVKEMTSDDLMDWRLCSSDLVERFVEHLGDNADRLMSAYGKLRAGLGEKKDARPTASK